MTTHYIERATEVEDLIQRAKALREVLATTSAQVDASGEVPKENLDQIGEAGLYRLSIPRAYGGLWDGKITSLSAAFVEVGTQLCAGEGSTGMLFLTSANVLRLLFVEHSELSETTRQQLAREVLEEHVRIVSSVAETGVKGHVTSRKVDGGIVINGTKSFNTGSGGARYANVVHSLEGEQGAHSALVPLDAPGVKLHHDWDNMGQRATISQTITYENVFVPDNWHWHLNGLSPVFASLTFLMSASVTLGIGEGGYDAMLAYVREGKRSLTPGWTDGTTDPLVRKRVGEFSTRLAAAHALLREASKQLEQTEEDADPRSLIAAVMRAQAACIDAAVKTTSEMFELTGARSTSNRYRLDRFWRNARTFSLHDPIEAKLSGLGGFELTGESPIPTPLLGK